MQKAENARLIIKFEVFKHFSGRLWELLDKYKKTGKVDAPVAILKRLEEITLNSKQNEVLKKTFYLPFFEDRIVDKMDLIKIVGVETAPLLTGRAKWFFGMLYGMAQMENITLAAVEIDFNLNKSGLPWPEENMKFLIINPEEKSYQLKMEWNSFHHSFRSLLY